jgi:putative IMPACT (imprinted ancient) family translation regulator
MLAALLHSGVGEVVAVVTRYYGGTKLGTGGLVRAYSGGVQRGLTTMPRTERVDWVTVSVVTDYARVSAIQQLFPRYEAEIVAERFEADVTFDLRLPRAHLEAFRAAALDATRGQATILET